MAGAIYVTPVDEVKDGKTIVHVPVILSMWAIRKIEDSSYFPAIEKADKSAEPVMDPPATLAPPAGVPTVRSTITFMDGVPMHVKEDLATIRKAI